jgi:hypothetical protein
MLKEMRKKCIKKPLGRLIRYISSMLRFKEWNFGNFGKFLICLFFVLQTNKRLTEKCRRERINRSLLQLKTLVLRGTNKEVGVCIRMYAVQKKDILDNIYNNLYLLIHVYKILFYKIYKT